MESDSSEQASSPHVKVRETQKMLASRGLPSYVKCNPASTSGVPDEYIIGCICLQCETASRFEFAEVGDTMTDRVRIFHCRYLRASA